MQRIFTAAGPFAAELMSEADAEVCSSIEYCSALGDSMLPVATSSSDAGPANSNSNQAECSVTTRKTKYSMTQCTAPKSSLTSIFADYDCTKLHN